MKVSISLPDMDRLTEAKIEPRSNRVTVEILPDCHRIDQGIITMENFSKSNRVLRGIKSLRMELDGCGLRIEFEDGRSAWIKIGSDYLKVLYHKELAPSKPEEKIIPFPGA